MPVSNSDQYLGLASSLGSAYDGQGADISAPPDGESPAVSGQNHSKPPSPKIYSD